MSSTSSNTRIKTKVIPLTEGEVKKAAKGAEPFIMPITEAKDAPYWYVLIDETLFQSPEMMINEVTTSAYSQSMD